MRFKDFEVTTYDLLGYFLPGFLVMVQLLVFFIGFEIFNVKIREISALEIIFLIIGAYIMGHLIQSISNILDRIFQKLPLLNYFSGEPLYQYLSDKNKIYTPEFRKAIKESAKKIFKLEDITEKEIFNLCYSLVLQKVEKTNLHLFISLYGFYRGLTYACFLGTILFLIQFKWIIAGLFLILWLLFLQRYKRFRFYFEDYVYRDFYVYYLTQYKHEQF